MKKQNTKINVSNNGGEGGDGGRYNDTIAIAGRSFSGDIITQLNMLLILSYTILFITSIILFCKFIYNLKSAYLMSVNKEALCSGIIYEKETLRNQIYIYFKDTKAKEQFQKTYKILFIISVILVVIILLFNIYINKKLPYTISTSSLFCISSIAILAGGYNFASHTLNKLYNISADYASKVATLKSTLFTPEKLNQLRIVYARETNTSPSDDMNVSDITRLTQGALVALEENINRRLLHTNDSGDVQTNGDANDLYNSLRKTDDGQDTLIGLVQFIRNTDDYNLLQSAVCGQNICGSKGVGKHLKSLSAENYTAFMNDFKGVTDTDGLINTFIPKVAKYDVALASELKDITSFNDPNNLTLTYLFNMRDQKMSQEDISPCGCVGNPLDLKNTDKMQVQSILNYLATLSNGDPSEEIQKSLDKFQTFLIIACVFIAYIIFHLIYNIYDKKSVVGAYFSFLLILAITLGLTARLH